MQDRKKLGEILVDLRILTAAEVERVLQALRLRRDHIKFGRLAREMRLLREEHILAAARPRCRPHAPCPPPPKPPTNDRDCAAPAARTAGPPPRRPARGPAPPCRWRSARAAASAAAGTPPPAAASHPPRGTAARST